MKSYKTVLFIAAVLLGLTAISLAFPEEGIEIFGVRYEFPALAEVLAVEKEEAPGLSPEEQLQQQIEEMKKAKGGKYEEFMKNSPSRIYFPDNKVEYLDALFEMMEQSSKKPVRIMHYGDSQIEQDLMTQTLRNYIQDTFGGGGVGLMAPVQSADMYTMAMSCSQELTHYCAYFMGEKGNGGKYGPMGSSTHLSGGTVRYTFSASSKEDNPHSSVFSKVSVIMSGSGSMTVSTDSVKVPLTKEKENGGMSIYSAIIPKTSRCNVSLNISGNLYGITLDEPKGVSVDNIPMRGCSGTIFTGIERSSIAPYFQMQNVGLIILQYGGNSVSTNMGETAIKSYMEHLAQEIDFFHSIAPNAKILFIGPADMATNIRGTKQTYPCMPALTKALKEMANSHGAAYWNMFDAMGGSGTIVRMVKEGLAYKDYTHFQPKGSEKVTQLLCNTLQLYYEYYKLRHGRK